MYGTNGVCVCGAGGRGEISVASWVASCWHDATIGVPSVAERFAAGGWEAFQPRRAVEKWRKRRHSSLGGATWGSESWMDIQTAAWHEEIMSSGFQLSVVSRVRVERKQLKQEVTVLEILVFWFGLLEHQLCLIGFGLRRWGQLKLFLATQLNFARFTSKFGLDVVAARSWQTQLMTLRLNLWLWKSAQVCDKVA